MTFAEEARIQVVEMSSDTLPVFPSTTLTRNKGQI